MSRHPGNQLPFLRRDPAARFVIGTAAAGSLADWTLFAALVAVVDGLLDGSVWATSLVLAAKILPAVAFAPLAARRADRLPLARTLRLHEGLRTAAVGALAACAMTGFVPGLLLGIVAFEYAAAMLAATRESYTSRYVPPTLFTGVNTATAVLGYGLLPVGAAIVQLVSARGGMLMAAALYGLLTVVYLRLRVGVAVTGGAPASRSGPEAAVRHPLVRTVGVASLALMPVVALFSVLPRLAEGWLGAPTATAPLTAVTIAGGALGFVAANRGWSITRGLAVATAGLAWVAGGGPWPPCLAALGFGAGLGYLGLQTRLQFEAERPSHFATAFAALKACAVAAAVLGPAAFQRGGAPALLGAAATLAALALVVATGIRGPLRSTVRAIVGRAIRVRIEGIPIEGPAVVVSNHPNAVDGVLALWADDRLRPVARWQRHPIARLGLWLANSVITTARTGRDHRPAYTEALEHLRTGGRIWLAPEGGCHTGRQLLAPRSGAVKMAHAAHVPLQILGIVHDRHPGPRLHEWRPWRRPGVTLKWGPRIIPSGNMDEDNDRMMAAIAATTGMGWTPSGTTAAGTAPFGTVRPDARDLVEART